MGRMVVLRPLGCHLMAEGLKEMGRRRDEGQRQVGERGEEGREVGGRREERVGKGRRERGKLRLKVEHITPGFFDLLFVYL